MSLNTILATAPLATTGFHLKATGTTIGNSLIWDNGTNVGIGNQGTTYGLEVTGTVGISGITKVLSSTASTSRTTGALVVTGGLGIGGALFGYDATFSQDINSLYGMAAARNGSNTQGSGPYFLLSNAAYSQLWYQQLNASNGLDFWYNGSVKLSIASTGAATFSSGIGIGGATATTGGIQFPATQVSSADANNLDDYEEGTWTPVIGGSGGQSGQTYSGQAGYYTKIGRQVTVTFRVALSLKGTITGDVVIKGLPFTVQNTITFGGGVTYWYGLATSWNYIYFEVAANETFATVAGTKSAVTESIKCTAADIVNNTQFNGSFTYFV